MTSVWMQPTNIAFDDSTREIRMYVTLPMELYGYDVTKRIESDCRVRNERFVVTTVSRPYVVLIRLAPKPRVHEDLLIQIAEEAELNSSEFTFLEPRIISDDHDIHVNVPVRCQRMSRLIRQLHSCTSSWKRDFELTDMIISRWTRADVESETKKDSGSKFIDVSRRATVVLDYEHSDRMDSVNLFTKNTPLWLRTLLFSLFLFDLVLLGILILGN